MEQPELNFTRPKPDDLFKPGSQNFRVYKELLDRPITNIHIVQDMKILNSTGRLSDIRGKLRPHLMNAEGRAVGNGVWLYELKG